MTVSKSFFAFLLFLLIVPAGSCAAGAAGPSTVASIQYSTRKPATRIVIVLTEKPEFRVNRALTPRALQIELNGAVLSPLLPQFLPVNDGRVKGIESFQYAKETAKVTIGLEKGASYRVSSGDTGGFVILIDITDKDAP